MESHFSLWDFNLRRCLTKGTESVRPSQEDTLGMEKPPGWSAAQGTRGEHRPESALGFPRKSKVGRVNNLGSAHLKIPVGFEQEGRSLVVWYWPRGDLGQGVLTWCVRLRSGGGWGLGLGSAALHSQDEAQAS